MRPMKSREIGERVVRRLNLVAGPEADRKKSGCFRSGDKDAGVVKDAVTSRALWVQGKVDTAPVRGTNLVEVSCTAGTPKLAADLANALADSYIDWSVDARFRTVGETSQFLSAQIQQVRTELDSKEKQLLAYGRQKDIVAGEPNTNVTMQNLQALNADFAAAVAERVTKEARYNEIRNAPPESVVDMGALHSISQLRDGPSRPHRREHDKP